MWLSMSWIAIKDKGLVYDLELAADCLWCVGAESLSLPALQLAGGRQEAYG